jgi:hypothetical protein
VSVERLTVDHAEDAALELTGLTEAHVSNAVLTGAPGGAGERAGVRLRSAALVLDRFRIADFRIGLTAEGGGLMLSNGAFLDNEIGLSTTEGAERTSLFHVDFRGNGRAIAAD